MNYIIFDLEATCWEDKQRHTSEIIEIGAIKINEMQQVMSKFNVFIRPILQPQLSEFCTKLTSISQDDIDAAQHFPEVAEQFKNWIRVDEEDYLLCSWGFYDKKQLTMDAELHKLSTEWLQHHISIKHQHQVLKNLDRPVGLGKAIKMEGLQFEGTAHRGIDDAKNIAKIFIKYFGMWKVA
ncbi:MAG: exonuclease domain-containing protein [Bacteroidales bacterium]|nr:exonuclease domain-containing protein [Bacteroidales bacterium]